MRTFNQFINEGIRDKMLPKSEEDIRKELDKSPDSYKKLEKIFKYKIELYTDKEIKSMLKALNPNEKYRLGINNNLLWLVQEAIDDGVEIVDDEDLVVACTHKNIELIELLLNNGGDVTVYVLEQAIHIGNIDIVNLLLEYDGIFVLEEYYDDLIYVAKQNKDNAMINFLKELNPYGNDLNEGIRDKMLPKSSEEILKGLEGLIPFAKLSKIYDNKVQHLFTDKELRDMFDKLDDSIKMKHVLNTFHVKNLYTEEEIINYLNTLSNNGKISVIINNDLSYDLLPDELVVNGDLFCSDNKLVTKLPDNLTVKGHLYAQNSNLKTLPDNLTVTKTLQLRNNKLTTLGKNLKVGGSISCADNLKKISLRKDTKIGGQFYN